MLVVSNIAKRFRGAETHILKDISFTVNAGERVGLIGPNGSGKTTLIGIIIGDIQPDSGSVQFNPPDLRVGYLPQGLSVPEATPVRDVLFPQARALEEAEVEVAHLAEAMAHAADSQLDQLMADYSDALERLEHLGYALNLSAAEYILAELGLGGLPLDTPVGSLSGGQKTRLNLAALLVHDPQLLILDEPTNHLDVTALNWLEAWLETFPGGVLVVSHDRTFLDNTVNRIVAIDPTTATVRTFVGDYTEYALTIRSERDKQWAQWRDQQVEIARLRTDAERTMAKSVRKENATKDSTQRRYARKVATRAKAKEKRLERYLDSSDRVEKPGQTWQVKMEFNELTRTRGDVITLESLAIGYDPTAPLLTDLDLTLQTGERVAVMGPNGHGKSTLLKTIIGEVPALNGRVRVGASVQIGYLAQEQEILRPNSTPLDVLKGEVNMSETEARSFLHFFLFAGDDSLRPVERLSYGERSRLMLALLVARGANLLVMDEPLNHLDLPSREKFEEAIRNFPGSILAVIHDRYFVEHFATTIWHIEDGELTREICQVEAAL